MQAQLCVPGCCAEPTGCTGLDQCGTPLRRHLRTCAFSKTCIQSTYLCLILPSSGYLIGNGIYYLPQASVTLAKSILESENVKSTTLPADFNYDPNNILQLFLKPALKVTVFSKSLLAMIPCTKKPTLHQMLRVCRDVPRGWRRASMSLAELTRLRMPERLRLAVVLYEGLARGLVCEEEEEGR